VVFPWKTPSYDPLTHEELHLYSIRPPEAKNLGFNPVRQHVLENAGLCEPVVDGTEYSGNRQINPFYRPKS
jgi:hypothetical protein